MTNPDNAGGLVWYVCTSCLLMVQLPSDTPTLGRCQCSPKGWSLRRAKLPKGYELCRAAPAGGDVPCDMGEMCLGCTPRNADGSCPDAAPAGGDRPVAEIGELSGARLVVLYSVEEIGHLPKGTKLYTRPQDSAPAVGRPYGGDPAEPRDDSDRYDSAPAGGDSWPLEVGDALLKWNRSHPAGPLISIGYEYGVAAKVAEIMRDSAPAGSGEVGSLIADLMDAADGGANSVYTTAELCGMAAALLRKLSTAGSGEVE